MTPIVELGYILDIVVSSSASSSDSHASMAEQVLAILTPTIGKFTARKALELAAQKCATDPDRLDASHTSAICDTLRPMLRTLVGSATTERVLVELRANLGRGVR